MHIKKLRLLTPGLTPLYPEALHALMKDFRSRPGAIVAKEAVTA